MGEIREISIREVLTMQLRLHEPIVVRSMTRQLKNRVNSISLYGLRTNDKAKILTDLNSVIPDSRPAYRQALLLTAITWTDLINL